jgi:hypothetical protein
MKLSKLLIAAAIAVPAMLTAPAAWSQAAAHPHGMVLAKPDELKWVEVPSLPGAKVAVITGPMNQAVPFTIRIRFPDNYKVAPHWHPAIEHVTVLSGVFKVGHGEKFDESKLTALTAGSMAIMQPRTPHFVLTQGETIVQLHGVGPWGVHYVNPDDDPTKK